MYSVLLCLSYGLLLGADAKSFLEVSSVSKEDVEASLLSELLSKLRPGQQSQRLSQLESEMKALFVSLPKDSDGRLSHTTVRYVLHRLMVQRHGWYMKGLEPKAKGSQSVGDLQTLKEWVPSYLQDILERHTASRGFDLPELAVFAATLEDLVHSESVRRLEGIYSMRGLSSTSLIQPDEVDVFIDMFVMIYLKGGNFSSNSWESAKHSLDKYKTHYTAWDDLEEWFREVQANTTRGSNEVSFVVASQVVEDIGAKFGEFNDRECLDLKSTLMGIEDVERPGRIPLSSFYKMGLHTHWSFTEKPEYLKSVGALDESVPNKPSVILTNYLTTRSQCLEASDFYAVCCRNECEDLMTRLETEVGAPSSTVDELAALVAQFSSSGVFQSAKRNLSSTLVDRLKLIGEKNDGQVPLHGRLFAQWLHHAFPRECPYPHEAGTISPLTPDEWMQETGQESVSVSKEVLLEATSRDDEAELHWSDKEELLLGDYGDDDAPVVATATESEVAQVSKVEVIETLEAELAGGRGADIERLTTDLAPMFAALPKDNEGRLGHAVVRYALHRYLVQRYGWYIKGLEPSLDSKASGALGGLKEWVPNYVQGVLERRHAGQGFDLRELAVFAGTMEHLVHKEAENRLNALYEMFKWPRDGQLSKADTKFLIELFTMVYLQGGDMSALAQSSAHSILKDFKRTYAEWDQVESWAHTLLTNMSAKSSEILDFSGASEIVDAYGKKFGVFNDMECNDLKTTLLGIEDADRPGRVRLSAFYKMGMHTHWSFNEKREYLRVLGALDESDPKNPAVLLTNYLTSRPQCLEASDFYAVCCRNECEDLMGSLETAFATPLVPPERLTELVAKLTSGTVKKPRTLSQSLLKRLRQIADNHDGLVPLHGRLFAQWMHHAFPRECPFPHEAGTTSPQTPGEWMKETGQASASASEEEKVCYVNGDCGGVPVQNVVPVELPWSDVEESYVVTHNANVESSSLSLLAGFLRTVALSCTVAGLVVTSRFAIPKPVEDASAKHKQNPDYGWLITVALLVFPLLVVTVDYLLAYSANEFLVCGLCWGLAGMVVAKLRESRQLQLPRRFDFDVRV